MVQSALHGLPTTPLFGGGHELALTPLLVLPDRTVGGAIAGVLVPFRLALETVKDRSDRLLTRGMASGNVEELLGGLRALMS